MDDHEVPGLDLARFTRFFDAACPGVVTAPLRGRVIAGGKSNLTYEVTDGSGSWIVFDAVGTAVEPLIAAGLASLKENP